MNDAIFRNTWFGGGLKYGGQVIAAGVESVDGAIFNISHPSWVYQFGITSARLGPGLGGGVGSTAIVAFNTTNILTLDGTTISDWGFNLTIGGRWAEVAKALTHFKQYAALAKAGAKVATSLEDVETAKLAVHYLWNAMDMGSRGTQPVIATFDLPAGAGAEVSLVTTCGVFNIVR